MDVATPVCACHGESMRPRADRPGRFRCRIKMREAEARYKATPAGKETNDRYEGSRIRTLIGGVWSTYRVPPERKAELVGRLAEFRAGQRADYREEIVNGRINPTVA